MMNSPSADDVKWLDTILDRFELEWAEGREPAIEDYARSVTGRRRRLLLYELVCTEFEIRKKRGKDVSEKDYLVRHPQLADELPSILRDMRSRTSTARACDEAGAATTRSFHRRETDTGDSNVKQEPAHAEALRELGDFHLIEKIAQGGMGRTRTICRISEAKKSRIRFPDVIRTDIANDLTIPHPPYLESPLVQGTFPLRQ